MHKQHKRHQPQQCKQQQQHKQQLKQQQQCKQQRKQQQRKQQRKQCKQQRKQQRKQQCKQQQHGNVRRQVYNFSFISLSPSSSKPPVYRWYKPLDNLIIIMNCWAGGVTEIRSPFVEKK